MSPVPGRSTLITSAPNHASSWVQVGPDWTWVKSRILTPSSALPSWPHGFFDIFSAFAAALSTTFSAGFFAAFAFSLAFSLALAFAFFSFLSFFFAMVGPLFLLELALRVEIADAAAFAAGGRIDHRV